MSPHSLDVSAADFEQAVIEASKTVPVVVDFWAAWCGPCLALKPVLEKLAAEYQGKFRLAKVNSDDNQPLAQRYGVRGIPNVKAFVNGELVDEFSGALPEPRVRAFLDRIIQLLQARLALTSDAGSGANTDELLKRIAANANDSDARLRLARQHIALAQYAEALDQLLEIVRRDRKYKDDGARKTMLQLFSVMGSDHPLVGDYRRKLAGALN